MDTPVSAKGTVLLMVDYQNDWTKGYADAYVELGKVVKERRVVENARTMLEGARKLGLPIIHLQAIRRHDYADIRDVVTDLVLQGKSRPSRQILIARAGTPGAEIVDELKPLPNEFLVVKPRRDAWYCSALEYYLRALDAETLIVGGVATHMAVEAVIRGASDRNYNLVVLEDCCADWPVEFHEFAMTKIFPVWARIMTARKALELLAAGR